MQIHRKTPARALASGRSPRYIFQAWACWSTPRISSARPARPAVACSPDVRRSAPSSMPGELW